MAFGDGEQKTSKQMIVHRNNKKSKKNKKNTQENTNEIFQFFPP